jgi:hypothetical protein
VVEARRVGGGGRRGVGSSSLGGGAVRAFDCSASSD